jgi:DNA-directed RNA polymerase specialized sigma24 family protein
VTDSRIPPPGTSLDAGAITALFRDHHAGLVRLALLMVGDLPTAEDVVQDVYASLHRRSRSGRIEDPLPYVRAAVLNGPADAASVAGLTREDSDSSRPRTRVPDCRLRPGKGRRHRTT